MIHQSPPGARDLLPLDVAQKLWIETHLQQVFHRWGYHRIITSTLERLDTLMAGGAIQPSTVIQLLEAEEQSLGLRPELTASIARTAMSRQTGSNWWPQRLYYNSNIFRKGGKMNYGGQQEFYQAGVELLGAGGLLADGEILLLLLECVESLGLNDCCLILGEAGLTRALLSPFPEKLREPIRHAIAHLDRISLEQLPMSDELRRRAFLLFDLRGKPEDVLSQVGQFELNSEQQEDLNNLKSLINLLQQCWSARASQSSVSVSHPAIILDLSLIQTFDYYTGIVFNIVSHTEAEARILGQGGRYDQLLGLYHPQGQTEPGIGFSLNLEDLHQVLLEMGQLPRDIRPNDWLVVPEIPQAYATAFAYAEKLRGASHVVRVEMELGYWETPEAVHDYARKRGINQIAWVNIDGVSQIESVS